MECYYCSEPRRIGYRKRMHSIWTNKDILLVTEQRLTDQKNLIIKKQWLSDLELEDIKQSIKNAVYEQVEQEMSMKIEAKNLVIM